MGYFSTGDGGIAHDFKAEMSVYRYVFGGNVLPCQQVESLRPDEIVGLIEYFLFFHIVYCLLLVGNSARMVRRGRSFLQEEIIICWKQQLGLFRERVIFYIYP